jgi:hypothetical protein
MPTPTCLVMCTQTSLANFRAEQGMFREAESMDGWVVIMSEGYDDMGGMKEACGRRTQNIGVW